MGQARASTNSWRVHINAKAGSPTNVLSIAKRIQPLKPWFQVGPLALLAACQVGSLAPPPPRP
jgi:hypothetical protein